MIAFGVPLHIICFLSLAVYNILCLPWIFAILTKICLDVPGEDTLCFLYPDVYSLAQIREVFRYYVFKHFLPALFSLTLPGTSIMWMLVCLIHPSDLFYCPHFFLLFFFYSASEISTTLPSSSQILSSVSPNLLLIHSRFYFLISFIILLSLCGSLHFLTPCW